jgi:hypothetical protein
MKIRRKTKESDMKLAIAVSRFAGPGPLVLALVASLAALGRDSAHGAPQSGATTEAFVSAGLPVAISNVAASKVGSGRSERLANVELKVTATGNESVTEIHLLLFEFDPANRLHRVDGWVRKLDLGPGKSGDLRLQLERRIPTGHRIVLTADHLRGPAKRWLTDLPSVARRAGGLGPGDAAIAITSADSGRAETGPSLCSSGYRRALLLGRTGDRGGMTSYTCDQQGRSFRFSFNGKVLGE